MIYSLNNDNGIRIIICTNDLHTLWNDLEIVNVTKIRRLKWLGHLFRMQELDPCRKLTVLKTEGTRHVGKPKVRCFELVEGDMKKMGVRN